MEIFASVAPSVLSKIGKWVWSIAASDINYILCYGREVKKLKLLIDGELVRKKNDIQQEVDAATINGRTIRKEVSQWLTNLKDVEKDARRLEEQVDEVSHFIGCCWDCFSSYKIGKEVAEKIDTANKLLSTNFPTYSHEPPPPSMESLYPNRDFQPLLSTKSSMDRIWEALNNEFFYIIGVYGMGGVGKTTIMKEVAKRAKNEGQYNEVIMVTVSQNQDVKRMQTEIAEKLRLQLTAESEDYRRGEILERIKGARKILIILDDLWKFLDISEIGIPSTDENKQCKVVITTRSRSVCISMKCQEPIKVKPLSPKESWDLFKFEVGDVLENTNNLIKVAVDVAKECGGLPLAIRTLGRAMRDKDDISTWNFVLHELRQSIQTHIEGMEDSVLKCLRRSFDVLNHEDKLCFLFCSLFPEDCQIDIIDFFRYIVGEGILHQVKSMEAAWITVCMLLDKLKNCCLLLEGEDSEHFKMHDVVRDFAIWISSDKTYGFYGFANNGLRRWPQIGPVDECQRISFMGNSFDSLPEQPVFPKLRTMILKETQISTIPDRFFQEMEVLLVLDLRLEKVASLPSSFLCLVNLKALFLSRRRIRYFSGDGVNFDVTSLSLIGELKYLEILQLEDFEFGTVPKEFGNLTSLRCLDLLSCTGTIPRNLLSRLSRNLEQLYLTKVFSNWQVEGSSSGDSSAATFAELASLSCLTTLHVHIENPDVFLQQQNLNIGQWQALRDFKIAVGILPDSFGTWSRSRSKDLSITKSTYNWVSDLVTKTERLWLHNWSGMGCLIGGAEEGFTDDVGHKLFEVKELDLRSMPDMKSLCSGTLPIDILRKLSALRIEDCHKLIDVLPTSMLLRTHQLVESLVIRWCNKLEKVLSLNCVQEIEEEGQSAAAGIVLLPRLESIILSDLPELRSVWGGDDGVIMLPAGSLQNLQILHVEGCKSLKDDHILPPILPIPSLRELEISGCDSLTYLLSWRQAKGLPHLQSLSVDDCERMETVIKAAATDDDDNLASAVLLPRLESIRLEKLPELRSVWGDDGVIMLPAGSLQNLQSLKVFECWSLKDDHILPPILPIPSLRELKISGCDSLTYLLSWRQAKGLPHLQYLQVENCERMKTVIKVAASDDDDNLASAVLLPRLESIILEELPELRSVWGDDDGVIMLPAGSLQNLESLYIRGCKSLKDDHILPPILPIPSLRTMHISRCDSLTYLLSWRQAKGLPHLQYLQVENCERMKTVIKEEEEAEEEEGGATDKEEEESTVLPSLTELTLNRLPMLRSFFQGEQYCSKPLSSFKSLKDLKVAECPKLKKLPLSPVLESLKGDSWKWFESFEWGVDESIKERLRPVFQPWQRHPWESPYEDESDEDEESQVRTSQMKTKRSQLEWSESFEWEDKSRVPF